MAKKKNSQLSSRPNRKVDQLAKFSSLAFDIATINILILGVGYGLDKWVQLTFPIFIILAVPLSTFVTIYYLLKKLGS